MNRFFYPGIAVVLLSFLLRASAAVPVSQWEDVFELKTTSVGPLSVEYSTLLEKSWPILQKEIEAFMDRRLENGPMLERINTLKPRLLKGIGELIGEDGVPEGARREMFEFFMQPGESLLPIPETTLVVLPKDELKERLREGLEVPYFQYDPQEDVVTYEFGWSLSGGEHAPARFFLPIDSEDPSEAIEVAAYVFGGDVQTALWIAVHEVIEADLVSRLQPRHGFFRWFSDGAADSLAALLLERHFGEEVAKPADRDTRQYSHLKSKLNLRFWLPENRGIDGGTEREKQMRSARYAYAKEEVGRLIAEHGDDTIRRILDVAEAGSEDPASLLDAVEAATEVDIRSRLAAYEVFDSLEEGVEMYLGQFHEKGEAGDYEEALTAVSRAHELLTYHRGGLQLPAHLMAAWTLRSMDRDEDADGVLEKLIENVPEEKHAPVREALIAEAWRMEMPMLAVSVARKLLEVNTRNIPALSIVLVARLAEGELEQARTIAAAILEFDDGSTDEIFRNVAQEVLSQLEEIL